MGEQESGRTNPLDENFFYNSMLAKALVQLIPPNERTILRAWFDKLLELGKTTQEKEMRNEYMWFILLMLQCQKIKEPFNSMPPSELEPLRDLVVLQNAGNLGVRPPLPSIDTHTHTAEKFQLKSDYFGQTVHPLLTPIYMPTPTPTPTHNQTGTLPYCLEQPSKVYEEILVANDDNMEWLDNPESGAGEKRVRFSNSPPSTFFDNQPIPNDGIICYLSAFSDREF